MATHLRPPRWAAHAYFGIDEDIIWDVVQAEVPALLPQLVDLRGRLAGPAS